MTEYRMGPNTNPDDLEPGASPFHEPPETEITIDWHHDTITINTHKAPGDPE